MHGEKGEYKDFMHITVIRYVEKAGGSAYRMCASPRSSTGEEKNMTQARGWRAWTWTLPSSAWAWAGLYALYSMREKHGLNVQAFDMASGVGGTWFWNRYPGCRVDTESTVYTYSFDLDMFQNWHWSERYARQSEVLEYMNAVADKHDLKRSINFNTKIERAVWDEASKRWVLTTARAKTVRARYLIEAVGLLSSSYAPKFPIRKSSRGRFCSPRSGRRRP